MPGAELVVVVCAAGARIHASPVRVRIGHLGPWTRDGAVREVERVARADLGDVYCFALSSTGLIAVVHSSTSEVALLSADAQRELWRAKVRCMHACARAGVLRHQVGKGSTRHCCSALLCVQCSHDCTQTHTHS